MYKFNLGKAQQEAVKFATDNRYCGLFLPMGSGKTLATLLAIDQIGEHPWLIVAPPKVAEYTWKDEVAKWAMPLRVISLVGTPEDKRQKIKSFDADIYTLSCSSFANLYKDGFLHMFRNVVIDEISMFRDTSSGRFKMMKKMRDTQLKRLIGLTGTPAPNGIYNIFGILRLIDKNILGRYKSQFQKKYFIPGKHIGNIVVEWNPLHLAEEKIYKEISNVCYSCPKPNTTLTVTLIDTYVEMCDIAKRLYTKLKKEFILSLADGEITAATAACLSTKLQQLASGDVYGTDGQIIHIHSEKIDMLRDLLTEADDNCLIVYNYIFEKDLILKLPKVEIFDEYLWNTRQQKAALIHPKSGGYGLNLQSGGSIIIFYGPTWDLELYQQMMARLARQGQTKDVRVYRILTRNTIDERIINALQFKSSKQECLLNAVMEEYGYEQKC